MGRIVVYIAAVLLAVVTLGLLGAAPPQQQQKVAQPRPVAVPVISISVSPTTVSTPQALARPDRAGPELPPGGPVPEWGEGWWRAVAGATKQVGTGPVRTYSVEVEHGVIPPDGEQAFARTVDETLADRRGWTAKGDVALRRVHGGTPDLRIRLAAQETARAVCGFDLPYDTSCHVNGTVYLSAPRWFRGARSFGEDLAGYRQYMVNHEVGHFLGHRHEPCAAHGGRAPVMMQQTFAVANDELAAITAAKPQQLVVPRDGKVCTANPWPHPDF